MKTKNLKFVVSGESLQTDPKESINGVKSPTRNMRPKHLNASYTFDNFIEGPNNQFAKAAAQKVSSSLGNQSFNPLVVYGGVGLGKTHLLHAIGNEIVATQPRTKIVIASSEKFTLDFVNSLRKNRTIEFAQKYRNSDAVSYTHLTLPTTPYV